MAGKGATAGEVRRWLERIGLAGYVDAFEQNRIELAHLPELTESDLRELGVAAMGDRKTLLRAISALSSGEAPAPASAPERRAAAGERRHLTVLFSDLVGSTELSQHLDPEDLAEVIRRYQDAVSGAVAGYGGHVAKFMGDGVLAYFGWPQGYEDQAERAVRAGLDSIAAVRTIAGPGGAALRSRAGIATGLVVVGDLVSEGASDLEAVVGSTPNLAARLQAAAEPEQLVIEAETRRLIGDTFGLHSLGVLSLKGFEAPVPAWQVAPHTPSETRFAARHARVIGKLIGREAEQELLSERWRLAVGGRGQAVSVYGEAGIGKSRLVWDFANSMGDESHARILYDCSPYHAHSVLYPAVQHLKRACGAVPKESRTTKLEKLRQYLRTSGVVEDAHHRALAELLALTPENATSDELTPQQRRERMIAALLAHIAALGGIRPVLLLVEDAHWLDPTTEELLRRIAERLAGATLLMVVTSRPRQQLWSDEANRISLSLDRLDREETGRIAREIGGDALGPEAVARIAERADGVPLYAEELAKLLLESGENSAGALSEAPVPVTLQSSLAARLDSLGDAKFTAQIASVIGRSFSHELMRAVSPLSEAELRVQLDRMVRSELVLEQDVPGGASYSFKHALVQDAAYGMLLRSRRSGIHGEIAAALERQFVETAAPHPELVAHHYTEAGLPEQAIPFWQRAGQLAAERSAIPEAIAHLDRGMALLRTLPPSQERDRMELSLQRLLGPAQISAKGFPSEEAQKTLARARELCEELGDTESLFPVLFNLWIGNNSRGAVTLARRLAQDLMRSTEGHDSGKRLQAHHCFWTSEFFSGNPAVCYEHTGIGERLYDVEAHRTHKFLFGAHDPGVCALMFRCMSGCLLGLADRAVGHADDAVTLGEALGHPRSLAMALYYAAVIHHFRGEPEVAVERAEAALALCAEHGIVATGTQILYDRARFDLGEHDAASRMAERVRALRRGGTSVIWPLQLALLAEADCRSGRTDDGFRRIDEALSYVERTGERWTDSELLRIKGELLLARSAGDWQQAAGCFEAAIGVARAQGARALELRAATRLAQVRAENGQVAAARQLLSAALDGIEEGQEIGDLKKARMLMTQIGDIS